MTRQRCRLLSLKRTFGLRLALGLLLCMLIVAGGRPLLAQSGRLGPPELYPDPLLTPGEAFVTVGAADLCVPGYARSVRSVPASERAAVFAEYGLVPDSVNYELDHFIPLELGGDNASANLWPEPHPAPGSFEKDLVENYLHDLVCTGAIDLGGAQAAIVDDWYAVWLGLQGQWPLPAGHIWYTSVTPTARTYYCDDDATWQLFNHAQLRPYASVSDLLATYPGRRLHQPCADGSIGP